ncbi:hypothetical protein CTAYLR_001309 [Chrysophaeum taylorii]|uniref:Uncharacterized protein n=1 Tax=Chrysophaeum taylorii TaxID=2483200 RepID=A0AAD7UDJ5_9STRA|nr:hypothetical protein CTAYLR_001309 [Chrysophaeum taylorii]
MVQIAAAKLRDAGIKLLAIDFDQTLVSTHTGGVWQKTAEVLAQRVRPCMKRLVRTAIAHGINVAIVTFSPQVELISEVLALSFPTDWHQARARSPSIVSYRSQILVRGLDKSWAYHGDGTCDGKQPHLASVAEELSLRRATLVTKKSTLLVDDDVNNIERALRHGVNAVLCSPQDPTSVERGIDALLETATATTPRFKEEEKAHCYYY